MKTRCLSALLLAATGIAGIGTAQADVIYSQNFDDIGSLAGEGWAMVNESTPGGETGWFQGDAGVFGAYEGADDSYIAANFLNAPLGGAISNWLILPYMALQEGSYLTFFTRRNASDFFDTLEVRYATSDTLDTAAFSNMAIVETLLAGPDYPTDWLQIRVSFEGAGYGEGRIALRYVVDNTEWAGDYIGIDSLTVGVPAPAGLGLMAIGLLGFAGRSLRRNGATAKE